MASDGRARGEPKNRREDRVITDIRSMGIEIWRDQAKIHDDWRHVV